VITAAYIMIGGMRSVAWTDAIQCLLLIAGMFLAGIAMVHSLGGLDEFAAQVRDLPEKSLTMPGNTGFWKLPMLFTICVLMPIGGILQPAQWMRFYSARDAATLRRSALVFIVILTGSFLFGIMLVGLGGQVLFPLGESVTGGVQPHAEVGRYDQVLVVIIRETLPEILGPALGLTLASGVIVAIMAAAMSTADSNLHALSALVTRDLYGRFVRPRASERERVWVGRLVILASTLGALWLLLLGQREDSSIAGFMQMIVDLALFAVAFSVQLLPITVDMLYIRRGTKWGAVAGLVVGLVVAFCFTRLFPTLVSLIAGQATLEDPSFLKAVLEAVNQAKTALPIHATAWGLIPNILIFFLVSLVTPRLPTRRN